MEMTASSEIKSALSVTEIVGPIVCGPSSSHTVGAARIGNQVYSLCGNAAPFWVAFVLFNSFAGTGFLHGTHEALLAGVLGVTPDDPSMWNAPAIAQAKQVAYTFEEVLQDPSKHPNAVVVSFRFRRNGLVCEGEVLGESLGGGRVRVTERHPPRVIESEVAQHG